jgi:Tol biopolymer transport system component
MKHSCYLLILMMLASLPSAAGGWKISSQAIKLAGEPGKVYAHPQWSADGAYIAFTSESYAGLWVMDLASGEVRQLSGDAGAGFGFSWSRSGAAIVARSSRFENRRRLNAVKIFDAVSGTETVVSDFQAGRMTLPGWADGDSKVYFHQGRNFRIIDSGRGRAAELGSKLLPFLQDGDISIAHLDDARVERLDPLAGADYINLTVSPDGTRLAFEVMGGNLHTVNIDGSGLTDLGEGYRPHWSPDGQYLVYMVTQDDGHEYLAADLYIIRADGDERQQLTDSDMLEMNPSWAPDGRHITFDSPGDGAIYMVDLQRTP